MQKAKSPVEVPYWGIKSERLELRGKQYNPSRYCGKGLPKIPAAIRLLPRAQSRAADPLARP